jgi:phage/plasmid-associated DNA primase
MTKKEKNCGDIKKYSLWSVKDYNMTKKQIETLEEKYELEEKIELLETLSNGFHDRIFPDNIYKIFGDCDHYKKTHIEFFKLLSNFLHKSYDIYVDEKEIKYTVNKSKTGSYHFCIPKFYCTAKKLKEIFLNFRKENENEFIYTEIEDSKEKNKNVVDVSIYSNHWFRCPNQLKEGVEGTEHTIKRGDMKDFIFDFIEESSINIEDKKYLNYAETKNKKQIKKKHEKNKLKNELIEKKEEIIMDTLKEKIEYPILVQFIDNCFKKERYDDREEWIKIGHAIKNNFGDNGFELFKYFSKKSTKAGTDDELQKTYNSFNTGGTTKITISSFYYYAKKDNLEEYSKIIKKYSIFKTFVLSSVMISKYIKMLRPHDFIWQKSDSGNYTLYCYNGKFWEKGDLLMRIYIGNELYKFLSDILYDCFWTENESYKYKKSLDRLQTIIFKKEIVETTKEDFINNDIEFDNKWYLFGFKNVVYDLQKMEFRDYKQDDYICMNTGYDWKEPTKQEKEDLIKLIENIHPVKKERDLYLQIVSTGFEGRVLEKFVIFNGKGGNGKGLLTDILIKVFGMYGMVGNNAILFEKNKTGSNPEKNNMVKIRFLVFREPSKTEKIENSIMKEITGGGQFSARGHHESDTKKKLYCTTLLECNSKPLFAQEPEEAEARRIIDLFFGRLFTDKKEYVDEENNIFLADLKYKTEEFQEKHKRAFVSILLNSYREYKENNYIFDIPKSVEERTKNYLAMSSNILGWVNEEYEKTNLKEDVIKIKDMYDEFKLSEYYFNLPKELKRKYNKNYFNNEIAENLFLGKYYHKIIKINKKDYYSVITNYIKKKRNYKSFLFHTIFNYFISS